MMNFSNEEKQNHVLQLKKDAQENFFSFVHAFGILTPSPWTLRTNGKEQFERIYGYAYHLFQQNQWVQARALFLFLSLSYPILFKVELALAICDQALGQYAKALAGFQKAAQLDFTDPRPAYHCGSILKIIQETDLAKIFFKQAIKLSAYQSQWEKLQCKARQDLAECSG